MLCGLGGRVCSRWAGTFGAGGEVPGHAGGRKLQTHSDVTARNESRAACSVLRVEFSLYLHHQDTDDLCGKSADWEALHM